MARREEALNRDLSLQGDKPGVSKGPGLLKSGQHSFAFSGEGRVGQLVAEAGLITDDQLAFAIREQEKTGKLLTEILQELYGVSAETTQSLQAKDAGIETVDLGQFRIDPEAIKKVTHQFALENKIFPVSHSKDRLTVAMANPFELTTLDELQFMTRLYIDTRYAPESQIIEAIGKYYDSAGHGVRFPEKKETGGNYTESRDEEGALGSQVIRLVDALVNQAVEEEATDIHIEPGDKNLKVRFRIDGILHLRPSIAKALQPAVIARVKIMANMDISESRLPQDGRISFVSIGKPYDLRVSTFPTIFGEKIVIRILDKERVILGLEQLGLRPSILSVFEKSITRPHGVVLVTGPTGSGKTTTLYSTLNYVSSEEKNVMTLEDPVEYEIPNIQQAQVNPKAGLTFASGLRSMLRQDPDIILVGEMRDAETADVAIRAALTGHLVFSTLHTNDAVGAIPRLLDMGINPSLMASTFVAIIAQRLVRKVCSHCKERARVDESLLRLVGIHEGEKIDFYRGKGCAHCYDTGYRGQIGVFEIISVTPLLAHMILERSSAPAILEQAKAEGMTTMMEDGVEKAKEGLTTLDEVVRVAYTA